MEVFFFAFGGSLGFTVAFIAVGKHLRQIRKETEQIRKETELIIKRREASWISELEPNTEFLLNGDGVIDVGGRFYYLRRDATGGVDEDLCLFMCLELETTERE